MTTFALVHGAWHGAWCWHGVELELQARGHRTIAVQLPCEDVAAGCSAYATLVEAELEGGGDDVVLVGHSLAGLTIPLVADRRPVRVLAFLCALLPTPGLSFVEALAEEPDVFAEGFGAKLVRDEEGRSYWPTTEAAVEGMYPDCPVEVAVEAAALLRPQARKPNVEPCPLERWPSVASAYVLGVDDAAIAPAWSRRAAR